jgi:hypothetical protein
MRVMGLLLGFVLAGCAVDENALGASDARFIETMVDLRRAALAAGTDTAQFERLREEVLAERGVTEADLRAYVDANGGDLYHMAAVWDSISARLADPGPE